MKHEPYIVAVRNERYAPSPFHYIVLREFMRKRGEATVTVTVRIYPRGGDQEPTRVQAERFMARYIARMNREEKPKEVRHAA